MRAYVNENPTDLSVGAVRVVRRAWEDTHDKVVNDKLIDVVELDKQGNPIGNKSGALRSSPNFIKSKDNEVFVRGSGIDSNHKSVTINGIAMLTPYVWIKGKTIADMLNENSQH